MKLIHFGFSALLLGASSILFLSHLLWRLLRGTMFRQSKQRKWFMVIRRWMLL